MNIKLLVVLTVAVSAILASSFYLYEIGDLDLESIGVTEESDLLLMSEADSVTMEVSSSDPVLDATTIEERRPLVISSKKAYGGEERTFTEFSSVTRDIAEKLCVLAVDGSCLWGNELIHTPLDLMEELQKDDLDITLAHPSGRPLTFGREYGLSFADPKGVGREYRVFLIHKDLLGRVDYVKEAEVRKPAGGPASVTHTTLLWKLNEAYTNENKQKVTEQLTPGTYELMIVDIETGELHPYTKRFRVGERSLGVGSFKEYASNTPLVLSYWDGRGILFDGKQNVDTVRMAGNKSQYDIFKGMDFPERNELNTVVFVQGGSAVIVVVNVELIEFEDTQTTIIELLWELNNNGGSIFRTDKFTAE